MQLSYGGAFWSRLQVWLVAFIIFLLLPVTAIAGDMLAQETIRQGRLCSLVKHGLKMADRLAYLVTMQV